MASSTKTERVRQQQILREAEGYLELLTVFEEQWPLGLSVRRPLAMRAMRLLHTAGNRQADLGRRMFLEGYALRVLERYDEAAVALQIAADFAPEDIHIWLMLGWCYKRCGQLDAAVESLETALEYEPGEAILYYNLACYLSLLGEPVRAVHCLSRALDINPTYREMIADESDFDPIRAHPSFALMLRSTAPD